MSKFGGNRKKETSQSAAGIATIFTFSFLVGSRVLFLVLFW
jgi:hypothetical protein